VGPQRHNSYSVTSATPPAVGLGRATTFSASSTLPTAFAGPSVAQPTGGPPGSSSSYRPPLHPASPLVSPGLNNRPAGTSTPPHSYTPYQRKDTHPYNVPAGHSPNASVTGLSQNFSQNMNIGPSGASPSTPNTYLPQHTAPYAGSSGRPSPQPMNAALPSPGTTQPSAPYNNPNPNISPQNPAQNPAGGYFGTTTSYGAGAPTGAYSSGIVSNPAWTPVTSPPSTTTNLPIGAVVNNSNTNSINPSANPYPATTSTPQPNTSSLGFAPPTGPPPSSGGYSNPASTSNTTNLYSAPTTGPPPQQQQQAQFPPPHWTGPNANQPAGYGTNYNAPALPPRPDVYPGAPSGSGSGQQSKYITHSQKDRSPVPCGYRQYFPRERLQVSNWSGRSSSWRKHTSTNRNRSPSCRSKYASFTCLPFLSRANECHAQLVQNYWVNSQSNYTTSFGILDNVFTWLASARYIYNRVAVALQRYKKSKQRA
jgi:hypothetical protein